MRPTSESSLRLRRAKSLKSSAGNERKTTVYFIQATAAWQDGTAQIASEKIRL
jgi:hypothetical protein